MAHHRIPCNALCLSSTVSNVAIWYKNQTILATGQSAINNRVEVMPTNSLRIRGIVAEDADDYYCSVLPQNVTQHTALRVGGRLSITCDDRDVTDRSQTFKQGDHHRLVCRTFLPGKTDIKWAFNVSGGRLIKFYSILSLIIFLPPRRVSVCRHRRKMRPMVL